MPCHHSWGASEDAGHDMTGYSLAGSAVCGSYDCFYPMPGITVLARARILDIHTVVSFDWDKHCQDDDGDALIL